MKTKRFATILLTSLLIVTVFGSVTVFAPPPTTPNPNSILDVFVTNTSDDPVPVNITDISIDVNLDEPIEVTLDQPIEVTNPSGEYLNVQVTNTPALQPFQKTVEFEMDENTVGIAYPGITIPGDKILVIEYISVGAWSWPLGQDLLYANLRTKLAPDAPFYTHFIGNLEVSGANAQFVCREVKIYAGPGTFIDLGAARPNESVGDSVELSFTISGHLVDVP